MVIDGMNRRSPMVLGKIAAIALLTLAIDWSVRQALLRSYHFVFREELTDAVTHVHFHIPFILAILMELFICRSTIANWIGGLCLWCSFGLFAAYATACSLTLRDLGHAQELIKGGWIWAVAIIDLGAIGYFWLLLPFRCPACQKRGFVTHWVEDCKATQGKCVRCGQAFFRCRGERSWSPGEPPTRKQPIIPPESEMFPGMMGAELRAAKRGRPAIDPDTGALQFRYDRFASSTCLALAIAFPILFYACLVLRPDRPTAAPQGFLVLSCVFALGTAMFVALTWHFRRFSLIVSRDGLLCRPPWKTGRLLRWDDIHELSYSKESIWLGAWFTIRATDGWKFRVSILVPGLSEFLGQCEQHLSREALLKARLGFLRLDRMFPAPGDESVANEVGSAP